MSPSPLSPSLVPTTDTASTLVRRTIDVMKRNGVTEVRSHRPPPRTCPRPTQVVLETEFDNIPALSLYESLGFIREKRLYRFYLNGKDAFRLVLAVPPDPDQPSPHARHFPIRGPLPAYPIDDDDDD